jgi:hypothetical protein
MVQRYIRQCSCGETRHLNQCEYCRQWHCGRHMVAMQAAVPTTVVGILPGSYIVLDAKNKIAMACYLIGTGLLGIGIGLFLGH